MASEDCDLIDLGNDVCVPRVSLTDPTPEEQEHLLDVCPPKLEQKLSLTVKQEQVQNDSDNGDVLVTLGHDQVVPIRKRIDVVSSDTIKRIRDITRNLEPVIRRTCSGIIQDNHRDIVDHAGSEIIGSSSFSEEETFEAQEINSAFDFLAEHEDNEDHSESNQDDVAGSNRSISSSAIIPLIERNESSSLEKRRRRNSDGYDEDIELDNPAFESSIYEVSSSSRTIANSCYVDFVDLEIRDKCKRRIQDESVFLRDTKRRSFQSLAHRKSWAEGTKGHGSKDSARVNRSFSLEESNQSCEPVAFITG